MQVHTQVTECLILCSFSEDAHILEAGLDGGAYQQFAASVQHVSVHLPVMDKTYCNLRVPCITTASHVCTQTCNTLLWMCSATTCPSLTGIA